MKMRLPDFVIDDSPEVRVSACHANATPGTVYRESRAGNVEDIPLLYVATLCSTIGEGFGTGWVLATKDFFISHSWRCPSWMKVFALCHFLNLDTAVSSATVVWISTARAAWDGAELHRAVVYWPMTVFFLVFFLGHLRCQQHWACLSRRGNGCKEDPQLKAQTLQALPVFVARSNEMLVLWDPSYLERLWCNYELAVFAKSGNDTAVNFVPVWLPIWTLSAIAMDLLSSFLIDLVGTSTPPPAFDKNSHVQLFLATFVFWCPPCLAYLFPSILSFLDKMATFDFRSAQCTLDSDRRVIRQQVLRLFESERRPIAEQTLQMLNVSPPADIHNENEIIDRFNAYVRGPLRDSLMCSMGRETETCDISWKLCAVSFLPLMFNSMVSILGCDGFDCEISARQQGYASVEQYMGMNVAMWAMACLLCYPSVHPLTLRVLHVITTGIATPSLQMFLGAVCALLVYVYVFFSTSAILSLLVVSVTTFSLEWFASFVIRCLLIVPFPESALNEEAGRLFMESYNEYYSHAAMMNRVHAARRPVATTNAGNEGATDATEDLELAKKKALKQAAMARPRAWRDRGDFGLLVHGLHDVRCGLTTSPRRLFALKFIRGSRCRSHRRLGTKPGTDFVSFLLRCHDSKGCSGVSMRGLVLLGTAGSVVYTASVLTYCAHNVHVRKVGLQACQNQHSVEAQVLRQDDRVQEMLECSKRILSKLPKSKNSACMESWKYSLYCTDLRSRQCLPPSMSSLQRTILQDGSAMA
eukprot:s1134_g13.t1